MPPLGLSLPPIPWEILDLCVSLMVHLHVPNLPHQMVCHHWYKRICILDGLHTRCHRNSAEVLNVPQQKVTSMKFKFCSDIPPHPWHTLRSDLFYYNKMDFLVVVDYFSKFLIARMNILIQKVTIDVIRYHLTSTTVVGHVM